MRRKTQTNFSTKRQTRQAAGNIRRRSGTNVVQLAPKDAAAYNNRALAYAELNDYLNAIKDYTKAIEIDPDYAEAYNNRANAYIERQDYQRAVKDARKACETGGVCDALENLEKDNRISD